MSVHRLDATALYGALERDLAANGETWRELGRRTGISATTFTRMKKGHAPSAHHLVTLLVWLGQCASFDQFIEYPTP